MRRLQAALLIFLLTGAVAFAAWPSEGREAPTLTEEPTAVTIAARHTVSTPVTPTAAPKPTEAPVTPSSPQEGEEEDTEPPYTEQDASMLAQMVWGEARGCTKEEQALCVWTVINRLEDGRFGYTLQEVLTKPHQFVGYNPNNPITDEILAVVETALEAWARGETAPALPPYANTGEYLYFTGARGNDGLLHNFFKEDWR
ncbi:MAG: hypothetical protein EOM52_11495 [Clostridia bacterium]|nr:hypothetical protein [Clostridia bacterium]